MRRKLMVASLIITVSLACFFSMDIEFKTDSVIIPDETISQLVYADTVYLFVL